MFLRNYWYVAGWPVVKMRQVIKRLEAEERR